MPKPPLTSEVEALVTQPNPAVVASVRADGTPHSAATWYEWRDGRVLLSMDQSRRRLQYIRANPSVSLTIFDVHDQYRSVTLFGRIAELYPDEGLGDIDSLAQRYLGTAYPDREGSRVSAWLDVERWCFWDSYRETQGLDTNAQT
jgi:PPOX class probable F420-dependent enzyme